MSYYPEESEERFRFKSKKEKCVWCVVLIASMILMILNFTGTLAKETYDPEHLAMLENKEVTGEIIKKDRILTGIGTVAITFKEYRLYISQPYIGTCDSCETDGVTLTTEYNDEDYLSVPKEVYDSFEVGDKIN